MKHLIHLLTVALVICISATFCRAEPFEPRHVAPEAAWVVHIDVDTLGKSRLWKIIDELIQKNADFSTKLAEFERIADINLPDDMHDVLLYGTGFNEASTVIVINSNTKHERLRTLVSLNETYRSQSVGGREIISWDDKGKTLYGAFQGINRVIIGQGQSAVRGALDYLDGAKEGLKSDAHLASGKATGLMLYVSGNQLSKLAKAGKARLPVVNKIDRAWFSAAEEVDSLVLKTMAMVNDPKTADQLRTTVEGFRAMINLAATAEDAEANVKELSDLLVNMKVALDGNTVSISLPVPLKLIDEISKTGLNRWKAPTSAKAVGSKP